MSFNIPPGSTNYQQPIAPYPCLFRQSAAQTQNSTSDVIDQAVPLSINWATSGPGGTVASSVQVNLGNQNFTAPFGVVQSLTVDNVNCAVNIAVLFPDTAARYVIPAGGLITLNVVSIASNFYVAPIGTTGPADFTDIIAFNFAQHPVGLEQAAFSQAVNVAGGSLTATNTQGIIASGVNGIVEGVNFQISGFSGAAAYTVQILLRDGNNNVLAVFGALLPAAGGTYPPMMLMDQSALNVPFINGLNIVVTNLGGTPPAIGIYNCSIYYHT